MELVDTHCHIQSIDESSGEKATSQLWTKRGGSSLSDVIDRATANHVNKLIVVGCSLADSQLACRVAGSSDHTWASVGIHPHEAKDHVRDKQALNKFKDLVKQPKVVAIGECGLDYYYQHSQRADQIKILQFQLSLAIDHDLPLIFHVRQAFDDFWPIFDSHNSLEHPIRGVLHSYTDNHKNLELALERKLYIGINGIATFNKNPELTDVYTRIPLNNLLLETDSPFLTPAPIRGTINEPKNIRLIAEYLAGLRGEEIGQLAKSTTNNARKLFCL